MAAGTMAAGQRLDISLAQWSVHRAIESGRLAPDDFPRLAREELGIDAIELVNTLMTGAGERAVAELRRRCGDHGVRVLLIMCDDEGDLSAPSRREREAAVGAHQKWLDAAAALGAFAIRVNTGGEGRPLDTDAVERCADSCRALVERAAPASIAVLLENHGGISSRLDLLLEVIDRVGHPLFGSLPDFGNPVEDAGPYEVVERLMPTARAVSAKCHDFDDVTGEETRIDFRRMIDIVRSAGYSGHLGIEYEGERLEEIEGIRRAAALLRRLLAAPGGG